jgi:hypothetical protein
MLSVTSECQQGRSCHLDHDLFIEHKPSNEHIPIQHIEEVFTHWGNAWAAFDFTIRDL